MKVLHVTRETGSDSRYGIRKSLEPVLEALRAQDIPTILFDQSVATDHPSGAAARLAVGAYCAWLRWRHGPDAAGYVAAVCERLRVAAAAVRYARRHNITHCHCHDPLLAQAVRCFARVTATPLRWGYTAHAFGRFVQSRVGVKLPDALARRLVAWESAAARVADWVVIPTASGAQLMAQELGLPKPPRHWHVVPHPGPKVGAGGAPSSALRDSLGVGEGLLIVAVGQLIPLKRFDWLVEIVGEIKASHHHLLILGDGPEEDRLRALADTYGLASRFHLASTDDIAPWLAAADIYVSPSSTEAWGMANCEALAAGLPTLCCAVGAIPEVLSDGALLVADSRAALADALASLLDDTDARSALAMRARQRAAAWWSAEWAATNLAAIYRGEAPPVEGSESTH